MYRFPMLSSVGHRSLSEARPPVHGLLPDDPNVQVLRSTYHAVMYDPIPQPRACLGWKPHPLHTWDLGTVDYPQLGSGPLLVAIPSPSSINGIFFRRPSPQDPGKSSGASFRDPGIPCNLGLVDHIARAIQRWNYCQVHEPFTCS